MSDAPTEHRAYAPESVACQILTVSDSRTPETDTSGDLIAELIIAAGHRVAARGIVRDEPEEIRKAVREGIERSDVDAVLVTGGTGVSPRDGSFEVVSGLLEKTLPGFGELFRALSFEEIGAAGMLSRAVAGTNGRTSVFLMPGSRGAVRLALERLIVPELAHVTGQLRR